MRDDIDKRNKFLPRFNSYFFPRRANTLRGVFPELSEGLCFRYGVENVDVCRKCYVPIFTASIWVQFPFKAVSKYSNK